MCQHTSYFFHKYLYLTLKKCNFSKLSSLFKCILKLCREKNNFIKSEWLVWEFVHSLQAWHVPRTVLHSGKYRYNAPHQFLEEFCAHTHTRPTQVCGKLCIGNMEEEAEEQVNHNGLGTHLRLVYNH
jgi:hypothetical protein